MQIQMNTIMWQNIRTADVQQLVSQLQSIPAVASSMWSTWYMWSIKLKIQVFWDIMPYWQLVTVWKNQSALVFNSVLKRYKAYSESKYRFAVKKSNKVLYKILLSSDSTFFKLFFHIFAVIIEALILAGHKFCIPFS